MPSILIVEDDPDISDLIAHYLQRAGHEVSRLTSGSEVMPRLRFMPAEARGHKVRQLVRLPFRFDVNPESQSDMVLASDDRAIESRTLTPD